MPQKERIISKTFLSLKKQLFSELYMEKLFLLSVPLRVFLSSIQATPAKNKHNVYSSKDKVFLTFKASFVEAAPPGKIFSIFITGWTLDSIPPDILMPAIKQNIAVEKTLRGCVTVLHYCFLSYLI